MTKETLVYSAMPHLVAEERINDRHWRVISNMKW